MMFETSILPTDTATHRTCGLCNQLKPFVDFYRDGKDADGSPKYRRDCKECYRKTRLSTRKAKREPVKPVKRGGRRK